MVQSETISDERLLERAREGDAQAFRMLVERYEGKVAATVIGMLGHGPEADDVGQETFIRFYRSLDRFRGEASLGTYLTRIAINQSLKAIRKRKNLLKRFSQVENELPDLPDEFASPERDLSEREMQDVVRRAVGRLPAEHRSVVVLRMLQGYSTRETAAVLDIPEGTVMSRLSRALDRLETILRPIMAEPRNASRVDAPSGDTI